MKKSLKWLIKLLFYVSIFLAVVFVISWIFLSDKQEVADPVQQEKAITLAEQYLDEVFIGDHYEIYDTAFETNDKQAKYNYAAMVRNKQNGTEFLIYYNNHAGDMEDNYIARKWADELTKQIRPFIDERFGKSSDLVVLFKDEIGFELSLDPNDPGSYKDHEIKAEIHTSVHRGKREGDKVLFNGFLSFLQNECELKHADVSVSYFEENVKQEEDPWIAEY